MSSILPCTCFPCSPKLFPSSLSCPSPHCPCGARRLFTEPDGTWSAWHMGHLLPALCPWFLLLEELCGSGSSLLPSWCVGVLTAEVFYWWITSALCCMASGVALKSFPPPFACSSRLAASLCFPLLHHCLYWYSCWPLLLFLFCLLFFCSFHSLLAWDSERKLALELCVWSLVELICWDGLQWETIVYPIFVFVLFFKTRTLE